MVLLEMHTSFIYIYGYVFVHTYMTDFSCGSLWILIIPFVYVF